MTSAASLMHALILAGGFGTRLLPLTEKKPKQLLPVCGKPAITYILDKLKRMGVKRIVMTINQAFAPQFKEALGGYDLEWIVEAQETDKEKLGAVGAIGNAHAIKPFDETTFIIGADNFAPDIDFTKMLSLHKKFSSQGTVALYKMADHTQLHKFGIAVLQGNTITGFQEKPKPGTHKSDLVSTAFYVVEPLFFEKHIPRYIKEKRAKGEKPDNLGELWCSMVSWGEKVSGFVFEGFWSDIGSLPGYLDSNKAIMAKHGNNISSSCTIHQQAILKPPVSVGESSKVGKAEVGPFVEIGKNCFLGDGAQIENCLFFDNVRVGAGARLSGCIADEGTTIAKKADIHDKILKGQVPEQTS